MNNCINSVHIWLNLRPKIKQWIWFILLSFGGMISFLMMAYPIKMLIRSLG